jgi:2Fe-2S ferredoxin
MSTTYQVIFTQSNPNPSHHPQQWMAQAEAGESLLDVARKCQAPVQTLCHGIGACIKCKVKVDQGELTAPTALEKDRMGNVYHLTKERMACQAQVLGACTLEIPLPRMSKRYR